jgi:alpha-glucuronidase
MLGSPESRFASPGYCAWLRYAPGLAQQVPTTYFVAEGHQAASVEIPFAIKRLTGNPPIRVPQESAQLCVGTREQLGLPPLGNADAYEINITGNAASISGETPAGTLYGLFSYLQDLAAGQAVSRIEIPFTHRRFLNHWDNPDGTIERGYAGRSIFFEGMAITEDLERVSDYGRLLASIGINGCCLNNVNAHPWVISPEALPEVARLADALRPFFVRTLLAVRFDSPKIDGLDTYDPLKPEVQEWWNKRIALIYEHIPDLAGIVIKADSEGEAGPSAAGRTHADAANMLARALAPFNGTVFYRGFVYNHKMDWQDRKLDRARAQLDNFLPLDGKFETNAVLQIKNGPIDFQVREPISPSFLRLPKTPTACEVMITQEYLGQQHHTVYEVPWWQSQLSDDDALAKIKESGFVAVCGVGRSENWLANDLAQANLYGFGKFAWNPKLDSRSTAERWATLTFGSEPAIPIADILMETWPTYEDYTGNLGIGGLTDIIHIHYGPAPLSSEHNGWGQWHRSDKHGTGMDRSSATGTGMASQYPSDVYESLATCPEELLLFFHHVPYTHRLKSGKTVIQHMYDAHYAGAQRASGWIERWRALQPLLDEERFWAMLHRFEYQAGHAVVWRDAVCRWFSTLSEIPDDQNRVFQEPNRISVERAVAGGIGYELIAIEPWEASHSGKAAVLISGKGTLVFPWSEPTGLYTLTVWHYDPAPGGARYKLYIDGTLVDSWSNTGRFPSSKRDAHTKTRRTIPNLQLSSNATIMLKAFGTSMDRAAVDFLEFELLNQ